MEALLVGTLVPGGFNQAGQVLGKKARPVATHGPPVWGLCDRLMSHLRKKNIITETRHTFQDSIMECKRGKASNPPTCNHFGHHGA